MDEQVYSQDSSRSANLPKTAICIQRSARNTSKSGNKTDVKIGTRMGIRSVLWAVLDDNLEIGIGIGLERRYSGHQIVSYAWCYILQVAYGTRDTRKESQRVPSASFLPLTMRRLY